MNLNELKAKYQGILNAAKTANRSLTTAETTELDSLKAEITQLEKAAADASQAAQHERNVAAVRLDGPDTMRMKTNDYLRSIAKQSPKLSSMQWTANVEHGAASSSAFAA